jgi:hypothetical protein
VQVSAGRESSGDDAFARPQDSIEPAIAAKRGADSAATLALAESSDPVIARLKRRDDSGSAACAHTMRGER